MNKFLKNTFLVFMVFFISIITAVALFSPDFFPKLTANNPSSLINTIRHEFNNYTLGKKTIFLIFALSTFLITSCQIIKIPSDNILAAIDKQGCIIARSKDIKLSPNCNDHNKYRLAKKNYKLANKYISQFNYEKALNLLQSSVEYCPTAEGYNNIGFINFLNGDYSAANDYFSKEFTYIPNKNINFLLNLNRGATLLTLSRLIESEDALNLALTYSKISIDTAYIYYNLSLNYKLRGAYSEALEYANKAFLIFKHSRNQNFLIATSTLLAEIYSDIGEFSKSAEFEQKTTVFMDKLNSIKSIQSASFSLVRSKILLSSGRVPAAIQHANIARNIFKLKKHNKEYILASINLIDALLTQGELTSADSIITEIEQIYSNTLDNYTLGLFLLSKANLCIQRHIFKKALALLNQSQNIFIENSMLNDALICKLNIGYIYILQGKYEEGIALTFNVLGERHGINNWDIVVNAYLNLARAYAMVGNKNAFSKYITLADEMNCTVNNQFVKGEISLNKGLLFSKIGEFENAINELEAAENIYTSLGAKLYKADASFEIGLILKKQNKSKSNKLTEALKMFKAENARKSYIGMILNDADR